MDVSDLARHGARNIVIESYPERGWNARMTDMQATLGLCQLELLDEILAERTRQAARYNEALARVPGHRAALRARVRAAHLAVLRGADDAGSAGSVAPS